MGRLTDGSHVGEPVEDVSGSRRERKVGEATEADRDHDAVDRESVLSRLEEDLGQVTVQGDGVDGSGRGVEVGRSGRPSGGDEAGVDDGGESFDTGLLNGDDERRRSGVGGELEPVGVGGGDDTDDEDPQDVEEQDSDVDSLDGSGEVSSGVLGLSGGDGDDLGSDEAVEGEGRSETNLGGSVRAEETYEKAAWVRTAQNPRNCPSEPEIPLY